MKEQGTAKPGFDFLAVPFLYDFFFCEQTPEARAELSAYLWD